MKPDIEKAATDGGDAPDNGSIAPGKLVSDTTDLDIRYGQTQRGLSPRHVQLMAIGGSIGTGLFVGIGSVLSRSGPLSLCLGYLLWGTLFVWPTSLCVAEMHAYLPIRGSIFELAARFVDPALGFALGWTYFYAGVMLVCVEYASVAAVMEYWNTSINPAVWIIMAMVLCILLNVVAVKWYGESEFIMASLKIILLFGLVMLTFITMVGGNPKHDAYGFRYWGGGNFMQPYLAKGDLGRFLGFWKVMLYAAFTIGGPDMIAMSAGEIQNPRRTIPRLARLIFYRIVGFYVVGVLAVGVICSSRDPRLIGAIASAKSGAAASPWVIGIQNLGIHGLPHLINFLVLMSGWSCGNAYLYSSSRTLYGLARDGQAPRFLIYCTRAGVPIYCVTVVSLITCVTFLVSSKSAITVFYWFIDLATGGFIAAYSMILIIFVGWHRARRAQGMPDSALPYVAPLAPYWPYFAIGLGCVALLFIGFDTFAPFDIEGFVTAYFCLPYSIILFCFWKFFKGTKFVSSASADLVSGKAEIDAECAHWEEGGIQENWKRALATMPWWKQYWERMW